MALPTANATGITMSEPEAARVGKSVEDFA